MNKKIFAVMSLALASTAFADQRSGDDQMQVVKERKVDQLVSDLGLSDDQKTKIQASREKFKAQITEKEAAYNAAKDKFTAKIQNPNATSTELEGLYKAQEDAHRALQDVLFQSRMEFRDVLTPEQRTKMISKHDEMKDRVRSRAGAQKDKKVEHIPAASVIQPVPPPAPVISK